MSDWWTYSLTDFLLFSPEIFFRLIARYNADLWPFHIAALVLGGLVVLLAARGGIRPAAVLLAAAWAWVGWAFLADTYATINWAALHAARAFWIQAALLLLLALATGRRDKGPTQAERAGTSQGAAGWAGVRWAAVTLMLAALLLYPLVAPMLGRPWEQAELFSVMPDPTALLTLGFLALAAHRLRWLLVPIPLLWCLVSTATLSAMDAPSAPIPVAMAMIATLLLIWSSFARRRRHHTG